MPEKENSKKNLIEKRVIHIISIMSGKDEGEIKHEDELEIDLGLRAFQRKALSPGFERIAKDYYPEAKITRPQCEKLKTVQESINLLFKTAKV